MSNTYSLINELYGVEPVRQQREPQSHVWLIIVIALAGMFLYESVHPVMRLRSNPPSAFVQAPANPSASVSAGQASIARSYWSLAAEYVSEKYSYGDTLPSNPPADFTLASGADYGTRALYWQRLRELWNEQTIWVTSYKLDTGWINGTLVSLRDVAKDYLNF